MDTLTLQTKQWTHYLVRLGYVPASVWADNKCVASRYVPADECVATAYVGGLGVGAKCGLEYDLTFAASGALQAYWGYATAETFSGPLGVEYDGRGWRDACSWAAATRSAAPHSHGWVQSVARRRVSTSGAPRPSCCVPLLGGVQ